MIAPLPGFGALADATALPAMPAEAGPVLRAAALRHGFVLLRGRTFTDPALRALGEAMGACRDKLFKYSTVGPSLTHQPSLWHHHSWCAGRLDDLVLYYTPAVPSEGGEIELLDATALLGALPPSLRRQAEAASIRHDFTPVAHATAHPPVAEPAQHPALLRDRPDGGRDALYLGMHAADGAAALLGWWRQAVEAEGAHRYRHRALPHDLIVWDQRSVAHRAHPWAAPELRVIHEVIVRRLAPVASPAGVQEVR